MLGSSTAQRGEAWKMIFELPNGTNKTATILKSKHFKNQQASKIQRQLISVPLSFVDQHNLKDNLNPLDNYAEEEIFETGGVQALILIGKDLLNLHPTVIDQFQAQESHDNIQNFIILLCNQMY